MVGDWPAVLCFWTEARVPHVVELYRGSSDPLKRCKHDLFWIARKRMKANICAVQIVFIMDEDFNNGQVLPTNFCLWNVMRSCKYFDVLCRRSDHATSWSHDPVAVKNCSSTNYVTGLISYCCHAGIFMRMGFMSPDNTASRSGCFCVCNLINFITKLFSRIHVFCYNLLFRMTQRWEAHY